MKIWKPGLKNSKIFCFTRVFRRGKGEANNLATTQRCQAMVEINIQSRTEKSVIAWKEFRAQAEKRYCSPHFNMEKKMEFYGFQTERSG